MYKMVLMSLVAVAITQAGCQKDSSQVSPVSGYEDRADQTEQNMDSDSQDIVDHIHNDVDEEQTPEAVNMDEVLAMGCAKASANQKANVYLGWSKKDEFLQKCAQGTNNSAWCDQVVRPNPNSVNTFRCTYGTELPHNLIHPDESTWQYPIEGVRVVQDLQVMGIKVDQIYNWWRPEPYNKNVGGAAGRHPYGTAIDVRFGSNAEANRAFKELCKMRKAGRIRAIGHYGSASLHIGVGDRLANTWGKSCN